MSDYGKCSTCAHDGCCDGLPYCGGSRWQDGTEDEEAQTNLETICPSCKYWDGVVCGHPSLNADPDGVECEYYEEGEYIGDAPVGTDGIGADADADAKIDEAIETRREK